MRVLIAEDEWLIATVIERILIDAGLKVVGLTGSITDALRLTEEVDIDAAVLDANLGGVSAEPLAAALSKRGVPYLVISGYADRQRSGLLAAAPFLGKPFAPHILVAAVQQLKA